MTICCFNIWVLCVDFEAGFSLLQRWRPPKSHACMYDMLCRLQLHVTLSKPAVLTNVLLTSGLQLNKQVTEQKPLRWQLYQQVHWITSLTSWRAVSDDL